MLSHDQEPAECSRGNQAGADFQIGSPLCLIGLLEPSEVMGAISRLEDRKADSPGPYLLAAGEWHPAETDCT